MAGKLRYSTQLVFVVLISLLVGHWLSGRKDRAECVKRDILTNFAGSLGMAIGFCLGQKASNSNSY